MKNGQKDEIIEEWMKIEYPEMSNIRDLELSEGINFVSKLGRLLDIAEENLTKHNYHKIQPNKNIFEKETLKSLFG